MPLFLYWTDEIGANKTLYFDAAITVGIESTQSITDHPVERGANITDHSRSLPDEITCEMYVTNSPIADLPDGSRGAIRSSVDLPVNRYVAPTRVLGFGTFGKGRIEQAQGYQLVTRFRYADFVGETYDILEALRVDATLIKVSTEYKLFDSMLIQQVSITDNEETGDDATFRLRLKRVRIVESVTVPTPKLPEHKKPVSTGKKDTQDSDKATAKKTVAATLLDSVPDAWKEALPSFLVF